MNDLIDQERGEQLTTAGYLAKVGCVFELVGSLKEAGGDCGWRPLDDAPVAGVVMGERRHGRGGGHLALPPRRQAQFLGCPVER